MSKEPFIIEFAPDKKLLGFFNNMKNIVDHSIINEALIRGVMTTEAIVKKNLGEMVYNRPEKIYGGKRYIRTGKLRNSTVAEGMNVTISNNNVTVSGTAKTKKEGKYILTAGVVTHVFYAKFVHFLQNKPYLTQALQTVQKTFNEYINDAIKRIGGKS